MDMKKSEAVVQLSTLLDLANLLSEDQKNILIQDLLKKQKTNKKIHLPISIFSTKLGCLETICKYLKENLNISFNEMAELLDRQPITLRTSFNNARKKHPDLFTNFNFNFNIPIFLLKNRKYTTFEIIIIYLKETSQISFKQIAALLSRNYKTIWTTYNRAKKK